MSSRPLPGRDPDSTGSRPRSWPRLLLSLAVLALASCGGEKPERASSDCVACHRDVTPNIVTDWELSRHSSEGVDCSLCHGDLHRSADDVALVQTATPDVCATCHPIQTEQFHVGKHALAWASMNAMPTTHWLPMALTEGMKGCGGCHRIGLKTEEEIQQLRADGVMFGLASCDTCHTSYTMFGDVDDKIRGVRHVWHSVLGTWSDPVKLYRPYENRSCLECHEGARSFEEFAAHKFLTLGAGLVGSGMALYLWSVATRKE